MFVSGPVGIRVTFRSQLRTRSAINSTADSGLSSKVGSGNSAPSSAVAPWMVGAALALPAIGSFAPFAIGTVMFASAQIRWAL